MYVICICNCICNCMHICNFYIPAFNHKVRMKTKNMEAGKKVECRHIK